MQLKHSQIKPLSQVISLMLHDLHFLILKCLLKIHGFSLALSSEVISTAELAGLSHSFTLIPLFPYFPFEITSSSWVSFVSVFV